jgi:sugar lactone lactonase YvrE
MTNARSIRVPAALSFGLLAALPLGCGGGDPGVDAFVTATDDAFVPGADAGPEADAFSAEDAFTETADAGASPDAFTPPTDDAGMMAACGGMRPDITGVTGTEGLVIGRDGAIYYSQRAAVGRIGTDGVANDAFVALPRGATQVWGMVPDAANEHLYVGSPSTGAIYDVDLTATPPAATTLVSGVGGPNGLTLGPDGALYFSDFSGGRVMRVELTAGATPTMVASLRSANGVAFDDAGHLLVCNYGSGELVRLTLASGVETSREIAASGLGSPDGVALDRDGTIYVTDNGAGRLLRVEADGSITALLTGVSSAASLDFGAGVLDCEDLYVASGRAMRRYEMGTVAGRAVPWH